ncbi:MAG TPA: TonB family protein [Geobacteraceae bacterium]
MPETLPEPAIIRPRHPLRDLFGRMLVASLLLHAVVTAFYLLPGRVVTSRGQFSFIDLDLASPQQAPVLQRLQAMPSPPVQLPATVPVSPAAAPSELAKLAAAVDQARQDARQQPEAVQRTAIGFGMTSGYFGSFADGETLRDDIRNYYFDLLRKVNEAWWTEGVASPGWLRGATVNLVIDREGRLVTKVIIQSSGNREYDQALLAALDRAVPLPPLPVTYQGEQFMAPLRFVAPLNLMVPGVSGNH